MSIVMMFRLAFTGLLVLAFAEADDQRLRHTRRHLYTVDEVSSWEESGSRRREGNVIRRNDNWGIELETEMMIERMLSDMSASFSMDFSMSMSMSMPTGPTQPTPMPEPTTPSPDTPSTPPPATSPPTTGPPSPVDPTDPPSPVDPTDPPTTGPPTTMAPVAPTTPPDGDCLEGTTREDFLFDLLSDFTDETLLRDSDTPQGEAFDWMVNEDLETDVCTYPTLVQRYALATIYFSTDGPNWIDSTNWVTEEPECEWFGIECDSGGLVDEIHLSLNNLRGPLPHFEIGLFPNLVLLEMFNNTLTGTIPDPVGDLSALRLLDLEFNLMTGMIPLSVYNGLTELLSLRLSFNLITGSIPLDVRELEKLEEFWVAGNSIVGPLPSELGTLTDLGTVIVHRNEITGEIPSELGLLSLTQLLAHENQLSGPIPEEFFNNKEFMTDLRVDNNRLSGEISPAYATMLEIVDFRLGNNSMTGEFGDGLALLTNMEIFSVSNNTFIGTIVDEFSDFDKLDFVHLSDNNFTGSLPASVFDIPTLRIFYAQNNLFDGPLPDNYDGSPVLRDLFLYNNLLSGEIPEIDSGSLPALTEFLLQENDFTGSMPDSVCQLRTTGILEDLWADCTSVGGVTELECDFPECCTLCFPLP